MVEASSAWGVDRCFRNRAVYHATRSKRKLRVLGSIAAKLGRRRELQFMLRVDSLLAHPFRHEIAPLANRNDFRRWNGLAVLLPRQRLKLPWPAKPLTRSPSRIPKPLARGSYRRTVR